MIKKKKKNREKRKSVPYLWENAGKTKYSNGDDDAEIGVAKNIFFGGNNWT